MPLVLKNKETFKTVLLGLAFLVGYVLVIGLLNKLKAYLKWRKTHIVSKSTTPTTAQLSSVEMYKKLQGTELRRKDTKLLVLSLTVPLVVIIIVIVASQFLIGTFKVDGVSMETTLHDKSTQWMYKLPVSLAKFNNGNVALNRGDVVVLHHDDNNLFVPEVETKKSYVVKRVIGLPGERIKVADGSITVFNKLTPPGINPDKGVSWEPVIAPSSGISIDITLKEGELFVVGDDREYSIDSRYYGPVKSTDVVGIVLYKHKQGLVPYKEQ